MEPRDAFRAAAAKLVDHVRSYMRDYPSLNRLVEGEESSDRMIARAADKIIADWNSSPPLVAGMDVRSIVAPGGPLGIFVDGIVAELLTSVAILQDRNNLPYTDGQVSVSSSSKSSPYLRIAQALRGQYDRQKQQYKVAKNIEYAWGDGISSDYASISVADFY
jgi:hypothetical protein